VPFVANTIVKLSQPVQSQESNREILSPTMRSQVTHSPLRKLLPRMAALCLLSLSVTSVSGQSSTPDPVASLRSAKLIYVKSSSALVGSSVIESKLQKRPEFSQMGLVLTRDENAADLVLEVHHDRFTKYVYTAVDPRANIVVAGGKLSSLGGTVAGKVAKRFLKEVMKARATAPTKT
jgi:hypothetical protein